MSDAFRKAVTSRLPPLPPTRAPWAEDQVSDTGDEEMEELEEGDSMGELGAASVDTPPSRLSSTCLADGSGYPLQHLHLGDKQHPILLRYQRQPSSPKHYKFNPLQTRQPSESTSHLLNLLTKGKERISYVIMEEELVV